MLGLGKIVPVAEFPSRDSHEALVAAHIAGPPGRLVLRA
jgi:hypothetical protein